MPLRSLVKSLAVLEGGVDITDVIHDGRQSNDLSENNPCTRALIPG